MHDSVLKDARGPITEPLAIPAVAHRRVGAAAVVCTNAVRAGLFTSAIVNHARVCICIHTIAMGESVDCASE